MELEVKEHPTVNLIVLRGRIDHASSPQFSELLRPHLEPCASGGKLLVLDFSDVDYISSAGLRVLMVTNRFVKNQGGLMGIAGFQAMVREVFAISRFDLLIPCFDSVEYAVSNLGAEPQG
jgi:anti-sigma B factor antagonist/stage II sporulation protein AA (anti-sigma F factor antagonist)